MKPELIEILQSYAVNEENQAGVKGNVIWEEDFEAIAEEIILLINII